MQVTTHRDQWHRHLLEQARSPFDATISERGQGRNLGLALKAPDLERS
jgi:hypothetical protein